MSAPTASSRGRIRDATLGLFFVLLAVLAGLRLIQAYHTRHIWLMGDWLLNYQGGFVRRGLPGEVFYQLSHWLGGNPGWWAALGIWTVYAAFLAGVYHALRDRTTLLPYYLFFWSPALFWFPVRDPGGAYRKDILFLALLAWLVARVHRHPLHSPRALTAALALAPLLILSHEALAAYLPYVLVVAVWARHRGYLPRWPRTWLLWLVLSGLAFAAVLHWRGTAAHEQAILRSWEQAGYPMPYRGAIAWLDRTVAWVRANDPRFAEFRGIWWRFAAFVPLMALAFVPVAGAVRAVFGSWPAAALVLTSLGATAVLMSVALDWGRFLYLHAAAWFLLVLLEPAPPRPRIIPAAWQIYYWLWGPVYGLTWRWQHVRGFQTPLHVLLKPWQETWHFYHEVWHLLFGG